MLKIKQSEVDLLKIKTELYNVYYYFGKAYKFIFFANDSVRIPDRSA